jgi:hypothetical protein
MQEPPRSAIAYADVDSTFFESTLRLSVGDRLRQNDHMAALAMRLLQAFKVKAYDENLR